MSLAPLRHAGPDSHARFHALYATHHDVLKRIARMLCGDPDLADDLLQDTWLRAWRAADSLNELAAGKAWLVAILKREHARLFERKRLQRVELDDRNPEFARDPAPHHAILLGQLLSGLADTDREPLLMQVVEGLSTAQIARHFGVSRNAITIRLHRLKKRLKAM
ncbi:MAG: sigma-70 family RNA polymerase sigma factor [Gammaproteobacteria bacterium]|nr:sigma-70 family RNA polymerase sigma factor [Gammaproteobacteria bacterium]MCB1818845.1 sigma-70 family RNA polymerase sigma factor [Gammaproteobacteria bacterium]MCP5317264.1 sigma-70 family RNA polymerase sigma factor [Chromatiaceae bacterium]MCW5586128.1 sigma-70 family RNA polymerase sigma factor [Chromatiales bacterium]HPQ23321.1 sigma-70 family RNA polymerase sigma factor [Gammaproteobacteria bacterium]